MLKEYNDTLENASQTIIEAYKGQNYCLIGKNNSYKTYILNQLSKEMNKNTITSLYIDSEENIGNNIEFYDSFEEFTARDLDDPKIDNYLEMMFATVVYGDKFPEFYKLIDEFEVELKGEKISLASFLNLSKDLKGFQSKEKCSSGINAILGILAGCLFCKEEGISSIIIDEIEKHLDCDNSYNLIEFLQDKFQTKDSKLEIIFSTHSEYVLGALNNYKIIEFDFEKEKIYESLSNSYRDIYGARNRFFVVEKNLEKISIITEVKKNIYFYLAKLEEEEGLSEDDYKNISTMEIYEKEYMDESDIKNIELLLESGLDYE